MQKHHPRPSYRLSRWPLRRQLKHMQSGLYPCCAKLHVFTHTILCKSKRFLDSVFPYSTLGTQLPSTVSVGHQPVSSSIRSTVARASQQAQPSCHLHPSRLRSTNLRTRRTKLRSYRIQCANEHAWTAQASIKLVRPDEPLSIQSIASAAQAEICASTFMQKPAQRHGL